MYYFRDKQIACLFGTIIGRKEVHPYFLHALIYCDKELDVAMIWKSHRWVVLDVRPIGCIDWSDADAPLSRETNFLSEGCRFGYDMRNGGWDILDVFPIGGVDWESRTTPFFPAHPNFLSEWCRCGADMKKPPMGSTWRTSHWWRWLKCRRCATITRN